jgi:hypothetical protein
MTLRSNACRMWITIWARLCPLANVSVHRQLYGPRICPATNLELFEALDKCGAGTVDIGVIVYNRITFDRSGKVIAEKPLLQIVTSWDRLRQVLLKVNTRAFSIADARVVWKG